MSGIPIAFPKPPAELRASMAGRLALVKGPDEEHEHLSACNAEFLAAVRELGLPIRARDAVPPNGLIVNVIYGSSTLVGRYNDHINGWTDLDGDEIIEPDYWFPRES